MKLTTKGKYALCAMFFLAQHDGEGAVPLTRMSDIDVPADYLERLLASLRKAGLIRTERGVQGGYCLARPCAEITVADILNATEGPVCFAECINDSNCCSMSGGCKPRQVWQYLSDSINQLLVSITLQDMLDRECFNPTSAPED